ncbi:ubiquitin-conjugating enzyme/RWD-like protein, partial [Amylocarpus encephaloides]
RRLWQELRSFFDEKTPYLSVVPIDGAWENCLACIEGPPNTAYERGIFWIHICYPAKYPHVPPKMKFITPIFHPNFATDGTIDLDFLDEMWSPINTTKSCLVSILSVFGSPLVSDRLRDERNEAQKMWAEDYESYFEIARMYTEDFA